MIDAVRLLYEAGNLGAEALTHFADFVSFSLSLKALDGRALLALPHWRSNVLPDFVQYLRGDDLGTVSGDDDGESLAFGLEALWPNPTHGTTRVAFTLPQAQDVTLDVFDVLGRRVMQIANDEYGSGRHVLPMSTSALTSGVYVVRLTAGSQTAVQRVTVAR